MQSAELYQSIFDRKSIRTYSDSKIPEDEINNLLQYFNKNSIGPFDTKIHLARTIEFSNISKIGTYGVIKGADEYLVFYTEKDKVNWLDVGYVIEKTILYLTSKGIGTCWIGGTFNRKKILSGIKNKDSYILPIITPIGYPSPKRSTADKILRYAAQANRRKPLNEIILTKNIESVTSNELYLKIARSLQLAPSASNKQPWRILFNNNSINLFIKRTKNYDKLIPSVDLQLIDIGIALSHLTVTLDYLNVNFIINYNNNITDNDYIISCKLT